MDAPIPGESLTKEPKNANWERPPEISDPEEAIIMHITRLQDEDRMNAFLDALEFEIVDLYTLVKGIMRTAVASGIHSIDVGLMAAPVVHEYIKRTADHVGIKYDDGINRDEKRKDTSHKRDIARAEAVIDKMGVDIEDFTRDDDDDMVEAEAVVEELVGSEESEAPKGLGSRRPNKSKGEL